MMLKLNGGHHEFSHVVPPGMTAHSLMDFPHIYPALVEVRRQHGYPD